MNDSFSCNICNISYHLKNEENKLRAAKTGDKLSSSNLALLCLLIVTFCFDLCYSDSLISCAVVSYLQNFLSLGPVFHQQYVTNILLIQLHVLLLWRIRYPRFLKQGATPFDRFYPLYLHWHHGKLRIQLRQVDKSKQKDVKVSVGEKVRKGVVERLSGS